MNDSFVPNADLLAGEFLRQASNDRFQERRRAANASGERQLRADSRPQNDGFVSISQMIASTAAKAGKPKANHQR